MTIADWQAKKKETNLLLIKLWQQKQHTLFGFLSFCPSPTRPKCAQKLLFSLAVWTPIQITKGVAKNCHLVLGF